MENQYYEGYLLDDIYQWELSDADKKLLDASIWLVDNRETITQTAQNNMYSKSTLHRLIHTRLRILSSELYKCVQNILNDHRRN